MPSGLRKTKIICTIGPATDSFDKLQALHEAGMDIVRLNMSHATHASAERIISWVKTLNRKVSNPLAVLLDTQGPEIRTGDLPVDLDLRNGDVISVSVRDATDVETTSIHVNYEALVDAVAVGDRITVDNGLINLEVLAKTPPELTCRVIDGGKLGSKRHVNLPGIRVNLPAITDKDAADIRFGIKHDIDFVALSFVRRAEDVLALRKLLGRSAGKVRVIAKIEDTEGVRNLDAIVDAADGVMVARGDLGVEVPIEELPNIQRRIVAACARAGRRVIVATHLLESMIENPIPTRAEVTDVANAVYEEVDAVMLSGETSVGRHPVRCVETLARIARASEHYPGLAFTRSLQRLDTKQHLAVSAVELAESLDAAGILVITRKGVMADYVTNAHPQRVPIFAFTNTSHVRRRLSLNRHLQAYRTPFSSDPDRTLQTAMGVLRNRAGLPAGSRVVVISDVIAGSGGVDAVQVRQL